MKRTQLNISIDPELLEKIKESARVSGKSLVGFVSDCCVRQIENHPLDTIDTRFKTIEQRLVSIEEKLELSIDESQPISTFTSREVKNFNEFIRAIFEKELKRKHYKNIKEAWNDFISHINCFEQWDEICSLRLKETLFIEHAEPLTGDEINFLHAGEVCPYPIRTGIINWINNSTKGECCCSDKNFPSEKAICEKGSKLVKDL